MGKTVKCTSGQKVVTEGQMSSSSPRVVAIRHSTVPPSRQGYDNVWAWGVTPCKVQTHYILVGELVVWSDHVQDIMPFYKIWRYVTREGRHLGCAEDSPLVVDEHLMIVFHDVLLWDEHKGIHETYTQRRQHLHDLVQPIYGPAVIGEQIVMDFTASDGETRLAGQMAFAVAQRWEGLVLKAC